MISKGLLLTFSIDNAKIKGRVPIFSLPAGWTCPGALTCLCKADKDTGKLADGSYQGEDKVRCYAASQEAVYTNLRRMRWRNFMLLQACEGVKEMADLICASLPESKLVRIHESGDFFSQAYFDAWVEVARRYPKRLFYAYTKSLPFWINRINDIPKNLKLNASKGGKFDALIDVFKLKYAQIVFSLKEAIKLKLPHSKTDKLAHKQDKPFALLLHGTQPAGTQAAKAWQKIKFTIGGYSRKK